MMNRKEELAILITNLEADSTKRWDAFEAKMEELNSELIAFFTSFFGIKSKFLKYTPYL